jgi:hypothetical protein
LTPLNPTGTISPALSQERSDRRPKLTKLRPLKRALGGRYRKFIVDKNIEAMPFEAIVPLDKTTDVLLLCSRLVQGFEPQTYVRELAFAHELAARNRTFAVTDDPSIVFDKNVAWFLPGRLVYPRLWDYSRQVHEFAVGMERQGNELFCSSDETSYWENKAIMHQRLAELGVPTPKTRILTRENRESVDFDIEPALIKEEHSAGSEGLHYFARAGDARQFALNYSFRPGESVILQEIVAGATKDLRLTMVGETAIDSATYWREKSAEAQARSNAAWTSTATTYDSIVRHGDLPSAFVPQAAEFLRRLGIRTAGIDLMWAEDDLSRDPVVLELSPYYQPNPPKPARYAALTYKEYKAQPLMREGYLFQQYSVFRDIANEVLEQGLY